MFAAKSDVSAFSEAELLRMDSKEYEVDGTKFRVSVLETTAPSVVLDRKAKMKQEEQIAMGPERLIEYYERREAAIQREKEDPFNFGVELEGVKEEHPALL